jgi:hypothetical protein
MQLPDGDTPSARAARLVLQTIAERALPRDLPESR